MSYNYRGISNNPEERQRIIYPYCFWNETFTDEELDIICNMMSTTEIQDAAISGNKDDVNINAIPEPKLDHEVRRSKVSFINPNPQTSWIFERLNSLIENVNNRWYNFDLNGYDTIQYTEYHSTNKGHYGWHTDLFLGIPPKESNLETRKLSLSLLLNDPETEFEGGELQFGTESNFESATVKKGTAILFPSFNLHRVAPVTKGIRKSLVVWVLGPKWK